ncbi:hypothetical protein GW17_00038987 [Ensete ventricosum]|nr:hypothetical protein GW17_00038987 [Ensete ventricosum]
MASQDPIDAKFEALKSRLESQLELPLEDKLRTLFAEFKIGQPPSPTKSQRRESSERPPEEGQLSDMLQRCMRVDIPHWEGDSIGGVSLQISIMWIPLERRTLDLLHPLHSDLEIQGFTIYLGFPTVISEPSPHARSATHGQATTKAPYKGSVGCGQGQLKGRPAVPASGDTYSRSAARRGNCCPRAHPLAAWCSQRGLVAGRPQGAAASRGSGVGRRGGRPLVGWMLTGMGSCRLHRGNSNSDGGGADGVRGVRASF